MTLHPNDKNQRSEKGHILFCKFEESISSVILDQMNLNWSMRKNNHQAIYQRKTEGKGKSTLSF